MCARVGEVRVGEMVQTRTQNPCRRKCILPKTIAHYSIYNVHASLQINGGITLLHLVMSHDHINNNAAIQIHKLKNTFIDTQKRLYSFTQI